MRPQRYLTQSCLRRILPASCKSNMGYANTSTDSEERGLYFRLSFLVCSNSCRHVAENSLLSTVWDGNPKQAARVTAFEQNYHTTISLNLFEAHFTRIRWCRLGRRRECLIMDVAISGAAIIITITCVYAIRRTSLIVQTLNLSCSHSTIRRAGWPAAKGNEGCWRSSSPQDPPRLLFLTTMPFCSRGLKWNAISPPDSWVLRLTANLQQHHNNATSPI